MFLRIYPPSRRDTAPRIWCILRSGEVLVTQTSMGFALPRTSDSAAPVAAFVSTPLEIGELDGVVCACAELTSDAAIPPEMAFVPMRELYQQLDAESYGVVGFASQMLHWRRTSAFCPVDGNPTRGRDGDWGRECSACSHVSYPHVTPAVLILVWRGTQILLGHKPGWGPRYSILAGFVEPGESLEECVAREVAEEVGLMVSNIQYCGSQPWPYPHQLMVGYTAEFAGGDITVDQLELDHAEWFDRSNLPELPPSVSLSRQLIDQWIDSRLP